jgi:hypothetical protein
MLPCGIVQENARGEGHLHRPYLLVVVPRKSIKLSCSGGRRNFFSKKRDKLLSENGTIYTLSKSFWNGIAEHFVLKKG